MKYRMKKSQDRNEKKLSANIYIDKHITDFNELIHVGAKLICEKIGFPIKKKSKPGWKIRLETQTK